TAHNLRPGNSHTSSHLWHQLAGLAPLASFQSARAPAAFSAGRRPAYRAALQPASDRRLPSAPWPLHRICRPAAATFLAALWRSDSSDRAAAAVSPLRRRFPRPASARFAAAIAREPLSYPPLPAAASPSFRRAVSLVFLGLLCSICPFST